MDSAYKQAKSGTFFYHSGAPKTMSQLFESLEFLIYLRFLSMIQFFGLAKIIIFMIFKLVPILWVSQFLSTIRCYNFSQIDLQKWLPLQLQKIGKI